MFGGKHGSLRKVLYKRNKSDSTSSSATSTSPNAAETGGVSPRPASQSFNFPLKPPPGGNPSTIVPPLLNSPSMQLDDSQFPQPPSSPTASGIPSASRLRVRNAGFDFNNPQVVYNSATCSAANTPMVDTDSPLTVDCTNCVCNINLPLSSNSSPGGGSANRANPPKSHRLFAPQFSGPASTNGGQDGPVCQVPGHEAMRNHHRSISASPQYYYNTAAAGANGGRSMPAALNVPLLIPLGPGGVVRRGERGAGRALHHRSSISGGMGYGQRASPGAGNNLYLATRLDHPTVFDFENAFMASMDSPMSCSSLNSSMPEINKIIFESQEAVYSLFMKAHKCYDLIPTSSKLVVFDTELPVSKAFFALVYNGVRAAPLWDSKTQEFVGMLTITDFIQILHKYYAKDGVGDGMKQLEEHKISTWRNVFENDGKLKQFVTIDPSESLYRAVQILCDSKIHRLPVLESATGNILYILTHKRLIKFLFLYINDLPKPAYMEKTPKELGIGSWGEISTISKDTLLIDALKIFLQKRVSALPLLDLEGRVVDIYAKFDAINLAADKTYNNLDETVFEALKQRSDWFEGVRKCSEKDNLMTVIDILVKAEVHRLIVTDDEQRVTGIISLSDILRHLVLDPPQAQAGNENLLLNTDSGMECDDVNSQEQLAVSS